jgi:hypothetical protein
VLEVAEPRLAALGEDPVDGHARGTGHEVVGVDERSSESAGTLDAHRRLARPHQPDQHEMLARHRVGIRRRHAGHRNDAR